MDKHERYLRLAAITQERMQQAYIAEKVDTARATAALQGVLFSHPDRQLSTQRYVKSLEEKVAALESTTETLQRNYLKAFKELGKTQEQLAKYKVMYASLQFEDESRKMKESPQASPLPSPRMIMETTPMSAKRPLNFMEGIGGASAGKWATTTVRNPSQQAPSPLSLALSNGSFIPPPPPGHGHKALVSNDSFVPPPPPPRSETPPVTRRTQPDLQQPQRKSLH